MIMATTTVLILGMLCVWGCLESWILWRERKGGAVHQDDGYSRLIIMASGLSGLGVSLWIYFSSSIPTFPPGALYLASGASVFIVGLLIRAIAVQSLGKHFSTQVAMQAQHEVIQNGVYAYVRHPSYTGLLLCALGVALVMHVLAAGALLLAAVSLGIAYRVYIEESYLSQHLSTYQDYTKHTKRFVPFVL